MKGRIIITTIIILYLALIVVSTVYAAKEEPEPEHTATPTPTATTTTSNCEIDKSNIQTALDAYYDDHTYWPTANGQSGDIIWEELVPDYMSEMPIIDSSCDWRVNSDPAGQVCVAHTC